MKVNEIELDLIPLKDPVYAETNNNISEITVACVWWGTLYGREYVENLRDALKRHLSVPYKFVCISDHEDVIDGVDMILTPTTDNGWWQKINLFKPNMFKGRVLYLDLDVVITNTLDPIVQSVGELVMIENFGPNKSQSGHNSSCMVWTPSSKTEDIYNKFDPQVIETLHGDQCWIWRVCDSIITDFKKELVTSYKYEKLLKWKRADSDTAIYVFHGKPKPDELNDSWINTHWRTNK